MAPSSSDICTLIDAITAQHQACLGPAQQMNIINMPLAVVGQGPIPLLVKRLTDIVSTTANAAAQFKGIEPLTVKSDDDAVFNSLREFVRVQQTLLNILIGKAVIDNGFIPYVGPQLVQVLRQLEVVQDTLLFELIDAVPNNATAAINQKDSLAATLASAIEAWSAPLQAKL